MADDSARLKTACDKAYDWEPAARSCSHAVWYVLKKMVSENEPYRVANALVSHLNAESSGWTPVGLDRAHELANRGVIVIGGAAATGGSGHVIVVYPGTKIPSGGYSARNRAGETFVMPRRGSFPRALSRSIGSWPGGVSRGDKTVWDPWGQDTAFAAVKFWAPVNLAAPATS